MMPAKLLPKQLEETMKTALGIAKNAWNQAEYSAIYTGNADENGKIALAILACKIFEELAK